LYIQKHYNYAINEHKFGTLGASYVFLSLAENSVYKSKKNALRALKYLKKHGAWGMGHEAWSKGQ